MLPLYEETKEELSIYLKQAVHVPPHLHKSVECVYVRQGSLALGIGNELYSMEEGDFAIVFPELIHHYQVFGTQTCMAYYLLAAPAVCGGFWESIQRYCPREPVIRKEYVHPDIDYALQRIAESKEKEREAVIVKAFFQILLARSISCFELMEKEMLGKEDIVYRTVSYIAAHFRESISLSGMAHDMGVSQGVLSKVFSKTFHNNFNQYVNGTRLDYACALLEHTNQSVTEICMNSGFESQRTFNRVFVQKYHMTPREYRNEFRRLSVKQGDSIRT